MPKTTDEAVAQATEGLDDNLTKSPDTKPIVPNEDKKPEVPPAKGDDTPEKGKNDNDDEVGFTADEIEEEGKPATDSSAVKPTEIDTDGLTPEAKYIVDNLPYMTARIKDGESVREVQVKSWTQLPEDIQFATERDRLAFTNALTAQENRALDLQRKFQATQQEKQTKDFEAKENEAIRQDVARLQREGDLPKFKVKADDPKFSQDPATQEVQKVLDFMNDRNKQYLDEYNQGRPYRHIGFEEAFHMYARKNPSTSTDQHIEDKERKKNADKVGGNRGLSSRELKKPTVRTGTRIDQILDRIDAETW